MKTRVGFVGVGNIAGGHLRNLQQMDQVEITAVCDIAREQVEKVGQQYHAAIYTDYNLMLEKEELDILYVCVPPFAHGDIEEKAVERGINVFVEKPVGLDMQTVRRKAEAIRRSGVIAGVGYCMRYLDTVAKAKEYLSGKPIAMVRGYYISNFVETPWWRDKAKSGGQLVEQSTHTVDLMRYLAGDITKVYANMNLCVMNDIEGLNIPDVGSVNFVFQSGAVGHIDTGFIQPDHRAGVEVIGRNFRVWINGTSLTIVTPDGQETIKSEVKMMYQEDKALIEAIRTQNRHLLLSSYEDAMKTLEATLAANQSSETGLPVSV